MSLFADETTAVIDTKIKYELKVANKDQFKGILLEIETLQLIN